MKYQQAVKLLDLVEPFSIHDIKKHYREKALQFHPDKNNNGKEMFCKIKEAHDFLLEYDQDFFSNSENPFSSFSSKHMPTEWKYAMDILLEKGKAWIYEYMKELMDPMNKQPNLSYTLYPTLEDMMNHNIHKMGDYCVPLWHREVHFDDKIFHIVPQLPDHIQIDHCNHLNIYITRKIQDVLKNKGIHIMLTPNHSLHLSSSTIHIESKQRITLENQGLSLIQDQDIYDISQKGNIYIHLELYYE